MEINKEFVPYEQSLALKELGFKENCLGYYYPTAYSKETILIDSILDPNHTYYNQFPNKGDLAITHNYNEKFISAPLYQQAFRWFREKYNINYAMKPILGSKNGYDSFPILGWDYDIFIANRSNGNSYYMGYPVGDWFTATLDRFEEGETLSDLNINPITYEESELECLKKLIEICQKKDSI